MATTVVALFGIPQHVMKHKTLMTQGDLSGWRSCAAGLLLLVNCDQSALAGLETIKETLRFPTPGDGLKERGPRYLDIWGTISLIGDNQAEDLLAWYPEMFSPGLGTVKGVTAHLEVKEGAQSQFCKLRTGPQCV